MEKTLANRIVPALTTIIDVDQKGFMANRRISINIRRILDIMIYAEENEISAMILSLDFEKCFDKIDFEAIFGALKFFNFSNYIIEWTRILYTNFRAKIQNNGKFSSPFNVTRSVHQGGPCSSFFFLLCAEMLVIAVQNNSSIQGIPVNDFLNVIGQYADDADIYQIFNQSSFDATVNLLSAFQNLTGFTVSYEKTQVYRIGSLKDTNERLMTTRDV